VGRGTLFNLKAWLKHMIGEIQDMSAIADPIKDASSLHPNMKWPYGKPMRMSSML